MAEEKQDGQKTLVAFVVGLLIGGMLVWAFSGPSVDAPANDNSTDTQEESNDTGSEDDSDSSDIEVIEDTTTKPAEVLEVGDGDVKVADQKASASVKLASATYPISEGWIGVREYDNENLGFILGVVRFSESAGLVPSEIILQRPTLKGRTYAVVIYTENGDSGFNLATDVQLDTVFDTFKAE